MSDFWPKNFRKFSELPSTCPEEQFVVWIFLKVLNRFGFSAETFGMVFKNPSSCPEWKLRKKYSFHSSFQIFFRILSEKFLRLLAKKLLEVFKTTFYVLRGTVFGLNFFLKIWIVLGFLQKPLAWFSKFYLRVQSKNSGRNNFFILLFRILSDFERKFFQIFGQKTSRSFQNYLLRVQRNSLWLGFFLKLWIVSDFQQKPLAWFSKFYLRVQNKNRGRNDFFILLFRVFSDFERKNFQTSGQKKLREVFKTTFYVSRGTVFGLKFF